MVKNNQSSLTQLIPEQGHDGRGDPRTPAQADVPRRYRCATRHRPCGADIEEVYLYTIDDLQRVIDANLRSRQGGGA
jgi:hypothetical protein